MTDNIDHYQQLAQALREIAGHLADFAGHNMPPLSVHLDILTGLPDDAADQVKMATIDAVSLALVGKTGETRKLSNSTYHYNGRGHVGPVFVNVFDAIASPDQRVKDEEIARLRAELAQVRGEPEDGHVYACCGKVGRISRHESWCKVGGDNPDEA